MTLDHRINTLAKLGDFILTMDEATRTELAESARYENPWYTFESTQRALTGVAQFLKHDKLTSWASRYDLTTSAPKRIGVIMAGNIPLVGFHDLLCVLISGHKAQLKLSSKDSKLISVLIAELLKAEPLFSDFITIQNETLKDFDAVIATGSDNTSRHFEYYFRKYPHIIRKNRSSCAILTGTETTQELVDLGEDIFSYFGLGCRNVSKLFVPEGYDFTTLLDKWDAYKYIVNHHKYANNYDYQKSILLVNSQAFLDNGYVLLQQSENLVSPISILYYEEYQKQSLADKIHGQSQKIQVIVGNHELCSTKFGRAQYPEVWDYADKVDTLQFLSSLN